MTVAGVRGAHNSFPRHPRARLHRSPASPPRHHPRAIIPAPSSPRHHPRAIIPSWNCAQPQPPPHRHSRVGGNPASFRFPIPVSLPVREGILPGSRNSPAPARSLAEPLPSGEGTGNKNQQRFLDSRLRGNDGCRGARVVTRAREITVMRASEFRAMTGGGKYP